MKRRLEYLYGDGYADDGNTRLYRFRIAKRTEQRVYYFRAYEPVDERGKPCGFVRRDDGKIGFVDRQTLDANGSVRHRSRPWLSPDYRLFASLKAVLADQRRGQPWTYSALLAATLADQRRGDKSAMQPDLAALRSAMVAAHHDKGGTSAAFIAARQRYVAARRAVRGMRAGEAAP